MERCEEFTFFQTKIVGDSRSIATKNICPGENSCRQLQEKTVCFHLSSNLLSETSKRQSFRMEVV